MSRPLEHDYIGLTDNSAMERSSSKIPSSVSSNLSAADEEGSCFNLKETELRLGLPGSQFPDRKPSSGVSLFGKDLQDVHDGYSVTTTPLKNLFSGAKRGYSDALDSSCAKWVFSGNDGSEVEAGKTAALLSPKTMNAGKTLGALEGKSNSLQASAQTKTMKEVAIVSQSPKPQKKATLQVSAANDNNSAPAAKAQVVGWPPLKSFRKNNMASHLEKINNDDAEVKAELGCLYVKVSMDGAPYLRKVDLKIYSNYAELSSALEKMFSCFTIGQYSSSGLSGKDGLSESCLKDLLHSSEYVVTYEDKDGDWMLVGDVPWGMFTNSCKRLRIMKGSEAIGLAPSAMEKSKNQN